MSPKVTAWATRSYRAAVALLLRRGEHEKDVIADDGQRLLRDAADHGPARLLSTWTGLLADALVSGVRHDLAQALRAVMRSPAYTATIAAVLGLGIAVTASLFALVNAVLLRPLPYDQPERLVMVFEASTTQDRLREGPSPGNVIDWYARAQTFDALTAWMNVSMTMRGRDGAAPVTAVQVTRGFFDVFRRPPMLGRTFAPDEYIGASRNASNQFVGQEPRLVLSHRLWRQLGADPEVVGGTVQVEGRNWRVIGVMPPDFAAADPEAAFWMPWDMSTSYRGDRFPNGPPRDFRFLRVVGRLKPGISLDGANAHMATVAGQLADEYPETNRGWSARVVPLAAEIVGDTRTELLLVFAAVMCLLVLVCANVAGLALARSSARTRELAIRFSLGAGRARVVRQLVAESAIVAVISGAVALTLTAWWLDAIVAMAPPSIPRLHEVSVDAQVIGFVALTVLIVTMIAGIFPAWRGSRLELTHALKDGTPAAGDHRSRLRRTLVVAELAVALMLLVGAGLLARSFDALRRVDPGFDASNLLVMRITPDAARYRTGVQAAQYYARVLDQLREVPAITSVAAATLVPMSPLGSNFDRPYWRDGARPSGDRMTEADVRMVTPDYFSTLRRPLIGGREFLAQDDRETKKVIVINESLARRTWPEADPVGRSLILDYLGGAYSYEVVGVARDARYDGPRAESRPEIFIPHAQNPYLVMNIVARTTADPRTVAETVRAQALKVDPDQPVHSVTTMDDLAARSVATDRFGALLLALFAVAGIVVAASGVYSLFAFTVSQRRHEIAVRLAVGAAPDAVGRMVLKESLVLAAIGGVLGLGAAIAATRLIESLLFGVTPYDPATLLVTVTAFAVIVVAATWWPARQAARVDPVIAMRG